MAFEDPIKVNSTPEPILSCSIPNKIVLKGPKFLCWPNHTLTLVENA